MEDIWLQEKTRTLIGALADIAEYINRLPNYREEDNNGRPTRESWLASTLHTAVNTATIILAYEVDVKWEPIDRDGILRHGQIGLYQLLVRYGLVTPHNVLLFDNERSQPKPLGMLDILEATWTFAHFDVNRPLYGAVTWEDTAASQGEQRALLIQALEEAARYAVRPQGWLLIAGPCGVGKSHLAGAIIRQAISCGLAPLYLSALAIAYRYRSPNDPEWMADQMRLETADLLVLDDLFLEDRIVWNRYIEQLLRSRHRDHRPTVLVSVRSRANLPAWLSDVVAEVSIIASDYRYLPKKQ